MSSALDEVLTAHQRVIEEGFTRKHELRYGSYAISALSGGVGKTTLAFNLAHALASRSALLIADLCARCNLTETLLRERSSKATIQHALAPLLLGPAFGEAPAALTHRVSSSCVPFRAVKPAWIIPGSREMFSFGAVMNKQLQIAKAQENTLAITRLLCSLRSVLEDQARDVGAKTILMDTSPCYEHGTHLAWCAAEAVVIPVRVDEHSLKSLELTLSLLSDSTEDFQTWNARAGGLPTPKVAAVVMTMVGSKGGIRSTPDRASRMYIERAIDIAERYAGLFDGSPAVSFVVTDDFASSGRISRARSIPITELKASSAHAVDGEVLRVNASVARYRHELNYLASVL